MGTTSAIWRGLVFLCLSSGPLSRAGATTAKQTRRARYICSDRGKILRKFELIVSDPPWNFSGNSLSRPGRNARRHYRCMPVSEILALPVGEWAAANSVLYLWVTSPFLEHGLSVLRAWGFTYKSSFVWVKDRIGTGYWARNRHEMVLIGRRGTFPTPAPAHRRDSVISGQQREHSRKPDALYDHLEAAYPDARKLDMFSRQFRHGWEQFGDEINKFNALEAT